MSSKERLKLRTTFKYPFLSIESCNKIIEKIANKDASDGRKEEVIVLANALREEAQSKDVVMVLAASPTKAKQIIKKTLILLSPRYRDFR